MTCGGPGRGETWPQLNFPRWFFTLYNLSLQNCCSQKRLLCIKKFCIPLNDLSCQWFKPFYFCTYSYKRGCLFIYLALYSTKWTELLLDISVATLSCCSIRRRPPWFGSPLEFPLCFWLRLWCFCSNPNIQGRSWRMNLKQGAQRVTVRASVLRFSETVIEKVILASVFILRADDLHGH